MKLDDFELKGKGLWIPKSKTLIIADLHIGYEESLAGQGILVPRFMFKDMKKEILKLLKLKPQTIIINGDLKHEFGGISQQEWHDAIEMLDILTKKSKVILVKGNHDTILRYIAKKKNVEIQDYVVMDDICVCHGHRIFSECFDKDIKTIIIAHEHPAITLTKDNKSEKYKCWLVGKWHNKKLIVMPSFIPFPIGSDVSRRMFSPFLKQGREFYVYAIGDKVYKIGKLINIKEKNGIKI